MSSKTTETFSMVINEIAAIENYIQTRVLYTTREFLVPIEEADNGTERWMEIEIDKVEAVVGCKTFDLTDMLCKQDLDLLIPVIRARHDNLISSLQKVVA